jgi:hypothetical protein
MALVGGLITYHYKNLRLPDENIIVLMLQQFSLLDVVNLKDHGCFI